MGSRNTAWSDLLVPAKEGVADVPIPKAPRRSPALIALAVAVRAEATSDPTALCRKTIVQQLFKDEKTHLKSHIKCLDGENKGVLA